MGKVMVEKEPSLLKEIGTSDHQTSGFLEDR